MGDGSDVWYIKDTVRGATCVIVFIINCIGVVNKKRIVS